MSQIDYNSVQLIVENNMRNAGFQGTYENGWKQSITINNKTYNQTMNLQTLRNIIAKSIVDALTNAIAEGTISEANISGDPVVVENTSVINLTTNETLPSAGVARIGDSVSITEISDPVFAEWIINVSAALNSLASGSVPIIPTSVSAKISTGSSTVQAGS